jgi:hypothetical protein
MRLQIVNITLCYVVALAPVALKAQVDAAQKTQLAFDEHKAADPTNPDRSLTGKSRQREAHISQVPIPSGPSPKTLQRKRELEKKKREALKQQQSTKVAAFSAQTAQQNASRAWTESDEKLLRRLTAEVEAYKRRERGEARISNVPVPRSSPK